MTESVLASRGAQPTVPWEVVQRAVAPFYLPWGDPGVAGGRAQLIRFLATHFDDVTEIGACAAVTRWTQRGHLPVLVADEVLVAHGILLSDVWPGYHELPVSTEAQLDREDYWRDRRRRDREVIERRKARFGTAGQPAMVAV
jgi:hypothetical protein